MAHTSPPPRQPVATVVNPPATMGAPDVLALVRRHPRVAATAFAAALLAAILTSALATPLYKAQASVLVTNEQSAVTEALASERFARDVALAAGLAADPAAAAAAAREIQSRVQVRILPGLTTAPRHVTTVVEITAFWPDAETAAKVAGAYLSVLPAWVPWFENATKSRNWEDYYENANGNATEARRMLEESVKGHGYFQVLDEPSVPDAPARPRWALNLVAGVLLGATLAIAAPLLWTRLHPLLGRRGGGT